MAPLPVAAVATPPLLPFPVYATHVQSVPCVRRGRWIAHGFYMFGVPRGEDWQPRLWCRARSFPRVMPMVDVCAHAGSAKIPRAPGRSHQLKRRSARGRRLSRRRARPSGQNASTGRAWSGPGGALPPKAGGGEGRAMAVGARGYLEGNPRGVEPLERYPPETQRLPDAVSPRKPAWGTSSPDGDRARQATCGRRTDGGLWRHLVPQPRSVNG